jgi:hypothetical protein
MPSSFGAGINLMVDEGGRAIQFNPDEDLHAIFADGGWCDGQRSLEILRNACAGVSRLRVNTSRSLLREAINKRELCCGGLGPGHVCTI